MADPKGANLTLAEAKRVEFSDPAMTTHKLGQRIRNLRTDTESGGYFKRVNLKFGELGTLGGADTTNEVVTLFTASGANYLIERCWIEINTPFAGGTISALTALVGSTNLLNSGAESGSDPNSLIDAAVNLFVASAFPLGTADASKGVALDGTGDAILKSGGTLTATMAVTDGNWNTLTAGDIDFVFKMVKMPTTGTDWRDSLDDISV